jgi:hypothetical protein
LSTGVQTRLGRRTRTIWPPVKNWSVTIGETGGVKALWARAR